MFLGISLDVLTSIASLAAIVAVLVGWYFSARKPLSIRRVVIHNNLHEAKSTFILMVRNVQSYPVKIHYLDCFTQKCFRVRKRRGGAIEYSQTYSSNYQVFGAKVDFEVPARGYTDHRVDGGKFEEIFKTREEITTLLFTMRTTHGYHELLCKDVTVAKLGNTEVYSLEFEEDFSSGFKGRAYYLWRRFKGIFEKQ